MHDFEIMFANARHYNEEDSQVYQDSITLEKVLRKKKRMLGAVNSGTLSSLRFRVNVEEMLKVDGARNHVLRGMPRFAYDYVPPSGKLATRLGRCKARGAH